MNKNVFIIIMMLMIIIGNLASLYFNDRFLKPDTNICLGLLLTLIIIKNVISNKTKR